DVRLSFGIQFVMSPAQRLRLYRPGVLHPAKVIDMVNVEVAVAAAAGPKKTVKSLNLPQQLARLAGPFGGEGGSHRAVHSIAAHQDNIANFSILNPLMELLQI